MNEEPAGESDALGHVMRAWQGSVEALIVDPYKREHPLLPLGCVHMRDAGAGRPGWYYEPSPESKEIIAG